MKVLLSELNVNKWYEEKNYDCFCFKKLALLILTGKPVELVQVLVFNCYF